MKITDKHVLFWGGRLSNFAILPYDSLDGRKFICSEQEFMYRKATYFSDEETAKLILDSSDPREIKKLGRKVRGFDEDSWAKVRQDFMFKALLGKFGTYPEELLKPEYEGKVFVEASPFDKIWGIGLREEDSRADDETQWLGLNLLGQLLGKTHDFLISEQ